MAAVCKGIVIASAADNDLEPHSQLCSKEVHDCAIWEDVKATVARMWEIECGDCIVDGIAVLMVLFCLLLRHKYHTEQSAAKFLLQATLVSFVFDFALELGLLLAVRDVSGDEGSIAQIKVDDERVFVGEDIADVTEQLLKAPGFFPHTVCISIWESVIVAGGARLRALSVS